MIDSDNVTGRKVINQYEVIEEIGRGMHGKVKLARNLETGENVAIKIIPRFSKKRRLGRVTAMSPQDKTKKEIAILKKIRHDNVVALLEVIDDPELKKIYMVLEHVELGEIVWRKKGLPHVCNYERRRVEREMRGEAPTLEERKYDELIERRLIAKERKRATLAEKQRETGPSNYWSIEHGAADEGSSVAWSRSSSKDDFDLLEHIHSRPGSPRPSSRRHSLAESIALFGTAPTELDEEIDWDDDLVTPGPGSAHIDQDAMLEATMYGTSVNDDQHRFRGRSPSMADSIISHMSSVDYNRAYDPFVDDYSYVPCFTFDQARSAFRDTLLGLEYLHYQGVVHRDIKPANLLWSKDHRVKISDFGVSYFGRPIREGEPDDLVSESEAKDFDNDLELAKTVGTPAFFAPELCYTDLDKEQPKVSEQIDVWSLGVTLYCLIYARIPFLAEDEFQMFKKIATEDVHISRRRLAPVDPSTSPATQSLFKRQNTRPYRDDNDIVYEEVDNLLYDLLRKMLNKNPEKRIRLQDIKQHPWVAQGMSNHQGWVNETDPIHAEDINKIQVDEREMSSAVVPLTLLERARFAVKKAVDKVIQPLYERSDSKSRHRATSSAASSGIPENLYKSMPNTPHYHVERRGRFFNDEYFPHSRQSTPSMDLASTTATMTGGQSDTNCDPLATRLASESRLHHLQHNGANMEGQHGHDGYHNPAKLWHRATQSHSRIPHQFLHLTPAPSDSQLGQPGSNYDSGPQDRHLNDRGSLRMNRDAESASSGHSRCHSKERMGLFNSRDKRAPAHVGLSRTVAPGSHGLAGPLPVRSADWDRQHSASAHVSPLSSSPLSSAHPSRYQHSQPKSTPELQAQGALSAGRHEAQPSGLRSAHSSMSTSPHSYRDEQFSLGGRPKLHLDSMALGPNPESTVEEIVRPTQPTRAITIASVKTSSTDSVAAMAGTPLTSPSETTSPVGTGPPSKSTSDRMMAFQSDPSLPALLSGASSLSADMESELSCTQPGTVSIHRALLETSTESLTPPAFVKESAAGFPIDPSFEDDPGMTGAPVAVQEHGSGSQTPGESDLDASTHTLGGEEGGDDGDDSDEGFLQMASKAKKKPLATPSAPSAPRRRPFEARRRDTEMSNFSTASDETAKRVVLHDDTNPANI